MANYTKLNLSNGDTLTATHIAHIEDGITAANTYTDSVGTTVASEAKAAAAEMDATILSSAKSYTDAAVASTAYGIPDYWITALESGAEAINTAMLAAGYNKSAFLFYSDAHWNYNNQMSPALLKYLYQHTGMTKTFFGGDVVNNEGADYDTMQYLWDWRHMLKDLPNHHSVVGNHDDGNTTNNLFDEKYVYGFLLSAEETPDVVRGDSGLYYYIDSPSEKTRYLFLDTAYNTVLYDPVQLQFIVDALKNAPSNWHIVAISHIWYNTASDNTVGTISYGGKMVLDLFDQYNSRSAGSIDVATSGTDSTIKGTVSYDFTSCDGKIEFCIGGHTHWDYDGKSTGGIPVILVETDSKNVRSGLTCTAGTTTENSVNGIICDYDASKITIVRIGRGASREVDTVTYTNVLTIASDADGSLYNGGKGYKENYRINSSHVETAATNWDVTGYIPINEGDVVRMKNVTFYDVNNDGGSSKRTGIYGFHKSYAYVSETSGLSLTTPLSSAWNAVTDDNGDVIQFTVTSNWEMSDGGFIRICARDINETSIITINEEII